MTVMDWREIRTNHGPSRCGLYLNEIKVASAGWNSLYRDDPNRYQADVLLPGLKKTAFRGESLEAVQREAERAIRAWFETVGAFLPVPTPIEESDK